MADPLQILARLPITSEFEYYVRVLPEMIEWISNPDQKDLLICHNFTGRPYEALIVDGFDTLFQFWDLGDPKKQVDEVLGIGPDGNVKYGIDTCGIYPDVTLPPFVQTAVVVIYKVTSLIRARSIERAAERMRDSINQTLRDTGLSCRTMLDPITGKCKMWLEHERRGVMETVEESIMFRMPSQKPDAIQWARKMSEHIRTNRA